jgi:hypothetical protein
MRAHSFRVFAVLLLMIGCGDDGGSADAGARDASTVDVGAGDATPGRDTGPPPADGATTGPLDTCFAGLTRNGDLFMGIQDMTDAAGTLRIRYARESIGIGTGETWEYETRRFGMVRGSMTLCVTERANLLYVTGHHNWNDTVTAVSGAEQYDVHLFYDTGTAGWAYTLTIRDSTTGAVREGPISLLAAGCVGDPLIERMACVM